MEFGISPPPFNFTISGNTVEAASELEVLSDQTTTIATTSTNISERLTLDSTKSGRAVKSAASTESLFSDNLLSVAQMYQKTRSMEHPVSIKLTTHN